jgi:uncharacterized protein (DUF2249 family)
VRPGILDRSPESARIRLDVREDIRAGREPFARIMAAVDGLLPDGVLVLRAPFEPVPLYRVLGRRGFAHWSECLGPDDWVVWFYRAPETGEATEAAPASVLTPASVPSAVDPSAVSDATRVDVRGLEPPFPMVRVLEALETLAPGQLLEVWHDRRPIFLYPQLEERGCRHVTDEPAAGLVRIFIWRPGPEA